MGLKAYRLSISWCRLFKYDEKGVATPKSEGVAYYQSVFKALKDANIVPIVTLFHWDLPMK